MELERERSRDKRTTKVKKIKEQSKPENVSKKDGDALEPQHKEQEDAPMVNEDEKVTSKQETTVKYPGNLNAEDYFLAKQIGAKLQKE